VAQGNRSRGGQLRQKPVGAFARGGVLDTLGLSFGGGSTPVTPQQRTQMEDYLRSRNPAPAPPPVSPTLNGGTLAPEHRQQIMDYLRSRDAGVPPPAAAVTPPAPQMAPVVGAFAPAAVTGALTPGSVPASVFGGMTSANAQPADSRGVAQLTDEEQKTLVGGDAERKAKKERQNKYFGAAAKMLGIDWLPYADGGAAPGGRTYGPRTLAGRRSKNVEDLRVPTQVQSEVRQEMLNRLKQSVMTHGGISEKEANAYLAYAYPNDTIRTPENQETLAKQLARMRSNLDSVDIGPNVAEGYWQTTLSPFRAVPGEPTAPPDGWIAGRQDGGVVSGPGDGRSDSVAGQAPGGPIRVSDGEFIIPADVVSALGNGSTKAGAKHLATLIEQTRSSWKSQMGAFKKPRS
jgi:hypothetical protein